MRNSLLAVTVFLLAGVVPASAQTGKPCLHDQFETPAERTRREKAVELAQDINRAQAMAFGRRGGKGSYLPFEQLLNLPATPEGFKIQFHLDRTTYAFSVKDMRDPCAYAVFSDQSGDVYEATPAPLKPRMKLLSED
jgi:hypothetical protein